jgi:hypothetical protein
MVTYNGMLKSEHMKGSSMMNKQPFPFALMLASTLLLFAVSGCSENAPNGSAGVNVEETRKQAEAGDAAAQNNLGLCYATGVGVPEDMKEAVKWYTRAAEQGFAYAQYNLGLVYATGEGVPKDMVKAYHWFSLAAVEDRDAAKSREIAAQEMTPDQIAEAQRLSAAFVPKKRK